MCQWQTCHRCRDPSLARSGPPTVWAYSVEKLRIGVFGTNSREQLSGHLCIFRPNGLLCSRRRTISYFLKIFSCSTLFFHRIGGNRSFAAPANVPCLSRAKAAVQRSKHLAAIAAVCINAQIVTFAKSGSPAFRIYMIGQNLSSVRNTSYYHAQPLVDIAFQRVWQATAVFCASANTES